MQCLKSGVVGCMGVYGMLQGRVACEVTSSESLLVTELVFQNVLADLTPEECVSLLSCLVFQVRNYLHISATVSYLGTMCLRPPVCA